MANASDATESLNAAIDRMQEALQQALAWPEWVVACMVVIALLCFIVLLHLLALLFAGPCVYAAWKRKQARAESRKLLQEEPPTEDADAPIE